ncbi:Nuclear nucleic acid-binding protein C1D [Pseudocercospora fuligena]|uniref:Exosome complex protein n=1 Tax=Pseudocercospora fuligena TaxID=685502 RepID=A0A8H6RDH3_9PEZI|nr:Nuclear nucleic acid-binding protein C1D [Pseudocercospora fuligena]
MESILPQIEDLTGDVDDLETALQPILQSALSASTSKLPLLDKAKLYVLATYAIESILFSYLRLNGVDAKNHPIFQELNRVKEYFNKIKNVEAVASGPSARLDTNVAGRFIKAGLSGNAKYDADRKERQERERSGAKRKLEELSVGKHTRFDGMAKRIKAQEETVNVVKACDVDSEDGGVGVSGQSTPAKTNARKEKLDLAGVTQKITELEAKGPDNTLSNEEVKSLKKLRKRRKKLGGE